MYENHNKLFFVRSYECQKIQTKNFNKNLGLGFNLRHLKMNTYCIRKKQFCKGL